jgi:prevent-host-death family protein
MADTYSLYEAKAKFSEIIRKVREGRSVTVSYRGRRVAEIRPFTNPDTMEDRLRELEARGIVVRAGGGRPEIESIARRPGALARFLKGRD